MCVCVCVCVCVWVILFLAKRGRQRDYTEKESIKVLLCIHQKVWRYGTGRMLSNLHNLLLNNIQNFPPAPFNWSLGELLSAGPVLSWLARLESDYCLSRKGLCVLECYTKCPSSSLGPFVSPTEQIDDNFCVPQRPMEGDPLWLQKC